MSQVEEFLRVGKRDLSNHSIIVTELDEDAKNDSSSMWKAIKQTLSFDHTDTNAIFSNGKPHISFVDIAENLNRFSNIGRYLAKAFRKASSALSKNDTSAYDFELNPVSELCP